MDYTGVTMITCVSAVVGLAYVYCGLTCLSYSCTVMNNANRCNIILTMPCNSVCKNKHSVILPNLLFNSN